jgi:hypothetical protein
MDFITNQVIKMTFSEKYFDFSQKKMDKTF